jgi:hypothetical protein
MVERDSPMRGWQLHSTVLYSKLDKALPGEDHFRKLMDDTNATRTDASPKWSCRILEVRKDQPNA